MKSPYESFAILGLYISYAELKSNHKRNKFNSEFMKYPAHTLQEKLVSFIDLTRRKALNHTHHLNYEI